MLSVSMWATLLGTFAIAVVSPGPDFLLVLRTSLQKGRSHGYATALGIAAGTAVWITVTITGLTSLLHAYPTLNQFTRLAGAALLGYFGIRILVGVVSKFFFSQDTSQLLSEGGSPIQTAPISEFLDNDLNTNLIKQSLERPRETVQALIVAPKKAPATHQRNSRKSSAAMGFLTTTVGNPKAVIFFSSLFASLLPAHIELLAALSLGTCMVLISFSWFLLVSSVAGNPRFVAGYQRLQVPVDAGLGILFIVLAALLVWQ